MKCYILTMVIFFFSYNVYALGPLEQIILELEYRDYILHGSKKTKPFDAKTECPRMVIINQKEWMKNLSYAKNNYMVEGEIEASFTREEIQNMKNENIHGVPSKVRGCDKILWGGFSYGNVPSFPHTYPGCESYFKEEVVIKEIAGKLCREVKFIDPNSLLNYRQAFCENSPHLYINIDPGFIEKKNDCFVGKDLVHCQN